MSPPERTTTFSWRAATTLQRTQTERSLKRLLVGVGLWVCGEGFLLGGADGEQTFASAPFRFGQTTEEPFIVVAR